MCRCACQISSDLHYQYLQTTRSTSEIFLWCAKLSLERLDTWHSTNIPGRFQCWPFIQKRWCNHTHICVSWIKSSLFCYSLKLNFICYLNRFFTFDYSLWDEGDIRFCGQKQTLFIFAVNPNIKNPIYLCKYKIILCKAFCLYPFKERHYYPVAWSSRLKYLSVEKKWYKGDILPSY